jgi:hypothetical protein
MAKAQAARERARLRKEETAKKAAAAAAEQDHEDAI